MTPKKGFIIDIMAAQASGYNFLIPQKIFTAVMQAFTIPGNEKFAIVTLVLEACGAGGLGLERHTYISTKDIYVQYSGNKITLSIYIAMVLLINGV